MTLSKLRVVLEASTGQFNRAMKATGGVFKRTSAAAKGLGASMLSLKGAFIGFLSVLAIRRVAEMGKAIFDLGAAVGETQSKFSTTFGAATKQVQDFLDEFANMSGLSRQVAQDLTSTTGAIIQGLGFSQQASADLSEQVVRMAGDFASFNNLNTAETLNAVTTALVGEREQMKRLGVVLLEADVQQRALLETGKAQAKQLTQQDKTLASLSLIYEKAGVQMGDLARTQSSAANTAKQIAAAWIDVKNTAAVALLPAFGSILKALGDNELGIIAWDRKLRENAATTAGWLNASIVGFQVFLKTVSTTFESAARILLFFGETVAGVFSGNRTLLESGIEAWKALTFEVGSDIAALTNLMVDFNEAFNRGFSGFLTAADQAAAAMTKITLGTIAILEPISRVDSALTNFALDFSDRIGRATTEGAAAFDGFVERVLQGLARIAAELAVFEGLKRLFTGSALVAGFGAAIGVGAGKASGTSTTASTGGPAKLVGAGAPVVFNQQVVFNVAALDDTGVGVLLKRQSGTIASIVAEAAQKSTAFKRALR